MLYPPSATLLSRYWHQHQYSWSVWLPKQLLTKYIRLHDGEKWLQNKDSLACRSKGFLVSTVNGVQWTYQVGTFVLGHVVICFTYFDVTCCVKWTVFFSIIFNFYIPLSLIFHFMFNLATYFCKTLYSVVRTWDYFITEWCLFKLSKYLSANQHVV